MPVCVCECMGVSGGSSKSVLQPNGIDKNVEESFSLFFSPLLIMKLTIRYRNPTFNNVALSCSNSPADVLPYMHAAGRNQEHISFPAVTAQPCPSQPHKQIVSLS